MPSSVLPLPPDEQSLIAALDAAGIGTWRTSPAGTWWSPAMTKLWGGEASALPRSVEDFARVMVAEDRERVLGVLRAAMEGETRELALDYRIVWPDGSVRWLEARGHVEHDAEGRLVQMAGVTFDVTARKEAEQAARRVNRALRTLSHSNQAIARAASVAELYSGACVAIVVHGGYRAAAVVLADAPRTVVAQSGAALDPSFVAWGARAMGGDEAATRGEPAMVVEGAHGVGWVLRRPLAARGKVFGCLVVGAAGRDPFEARELELFDELAEDLAFGAQALHTREAQLLAEQSRDAGELALRESEERLRQIADNIREVVWLKGVAENRILYVNPAYQAVWGRSCQSLYDSPRSFLEGVHPDDRGRALAAIERQQDAEQDLEFRVVAPDGVVRWVHVRSFPIVGRSGQVIRVVGAAEDITLQRRAEEQLRQSQKMEAVGQLAGGIAHDFNNILLAIMLQVQLAAESEELTGEVRESLLDIEQAAVRAAKLTRQLLQFGRKQVMQPRNLDVNEVVRGLSPMIGRVLREDVKLELVLAPQVLLTHADEGMLDQVLMNLAVNARDAMPGGGTLRVESALEVVGEPATGGVSELPPGRYVRLSVHDTGTGIAPEVLPHIFEPFFTTKDPASGTGLGLATVFGIVKQHRGTIRVTSAPGVGTSFHILLPLGESASQPDEVREGPGPAVERVPDAMGGHETILVVEDDAGVRRLTRKILEMHGYRVVDAPTATEAVRVWQSQGGGVDLLLTDIVMPDGVSGRELAQRLRAEDQHLKVLLTSGYSRALAGRDIALEAGEWFLGKPFGPRELLETVRGCLEGGASHSNSSTEGTSVGAAARSI